MKNEIKQVDYNFNYTTYEPVYTYSFEFNLNFPFEEGARICLSNNNFIQMMQELFKRSIEEYKMEVKQ